MPRIVASRPSRDEFLEMLGRYYEAVDAELRDRGVAGILPAEVEGWQNEDPCYDPLRRFLPEDEWKPFAPDDHPYFALLVDSILEVAGIFNPWDLLYRKEIRSDLAERTGVLPTPEV